MVAILNGIVIYGEITEYLDKTPSNKLHIITIIIIAYIWIYISYFISIRHAYHDLAIYTSTVESHKKKNFLIVSFTLSIALKLFTLYIYYYHRNKRWLRWVSVAVSLIIFGILIYQAKLVAEYHSAWMWWLKGFYATDVLFGSILKILLLVY